MSSGGGSGGVSGEDRVAAVRTANQAYYTALETGDLDALERLWLDGPAEPSVCAVHVGATPVYGRRDVLRSYALIMANTPYIQFILTDVRVAMIGDVAVVTCMENVLTSGEGKGAVFAAGRAAATKVFLRVDGFWRLWQHHASPIAERPADRPGEEAP